VTQVRVTAVLYSQLATRLRSLPIIIPIHLCLLSLESTCATVYHNDHTYSYKAELWRTCPYTIIAFQSTDTFRSRDFTSFTPVWRVAYQFARIDSELHQRLKELIPYGRLRRVQIPTAALSTHCRSLHDRRTAKRATSSSQQLRLLPSKRHIEAGLLQARISIVSSFNWAPRWQRRRVQRPTLARDASPAMRTIITTRGRDYSIRPMIETEYNRDTESNTIPTCQLSAIISRRTYNQWRDLTPESAIWRTEGEVERRLRISTVATTSLRIE